MFHGKYFSHGSPLQKNWITSDSAVVPSEVLPHTWFSFSQFTMRGHLILRNSHVFAHCCSSWTDLSLRSVRSSLHFCTHTVAQDWVLQNYLLSCLMDVVAFLYHYSCTPTCTIMPVESIMIPGKDYWRWSHCFAFIPPLFMFSHIIEAALSACVINSPHCLTTSLRKALRIDSQ